MNYKLRPYLACESLLHVTCQVKLTEFRIGSRGYHYFLLFQCFINRQSYVIWGNHVMLMYLQHEKMVWTIDAIL